MFPYIILFLIPVLGALSPRSVSRKHQPAVWIAFGILLTFFVGLRHQTGGDWFAYERSFWLHGDRTFTELFESLRDPGYYWVGWALFRSGATVHWLNLFAAGILSWGLIRFCRSLPSPWLGVVAAVPYLIIVVGMGYTRQAAAIGLALIAFAYISEGRFLKYSIFIILAALMHRTAIVLLPITVLLVSRNRVASGAAIIAMTAMAASILLGDEAERMWGSYVESEYSSAADGAPVRVAMNAVAGIFFLLLRDRFGVTSHGRKFWTIISFISLACLPLLAVSLTAVDRIALYLIPLQIFVAGSVIRAASTTFHRTGIALLICAFYAAVLLVWLFFAKHASYWLPYTNIVSEKLFY